MTQSIIALINPFAAFAATNQMFLVPGVAIKFFSWPLHCLIMLAITAFLITISVLWVRKAALFEAFGHSVSLWSGRALRRKSSIKIDNQESQSQADTPVGSSCAIKHVTGKPIVWREMQKGFIGRGKGNVVISVLLVGAFIVTIPLILFSSRRNIIFPYYLVFGFYLIFMIRLAAFSAGSIAAEKEARTWPVLLATPLEDKEIVWGKAIAAFRRNIFLFLLYLILLCARHIRLGFGGGRGPLNFLLSLTLIVSSIICSILFVIGSGVYLGVRLKTTTSAVVATVGLYLVMTYLFCGIFNPFYILLIRTVIARAGLWSYHVTYLTFTFIQGAMGFSLARRAVRRLRYEIF
jgi:ABC-type transport system involved in multi-copper enzyme maturation permease subunit